MNTAHTETQSLVCKKCGEKIPEGAKFCPFCAASADFSTKKKSNKIIAACIAVIVIICIAAGIGFYMHYEPVPTGGKTVAKNQKEDKALSADEILRNECFEDEQFLSVQYSLKALRRNPAMFEGVRIGTRVRVQKVLQADTDNKFSLLCNFEMTDDNDVMILEGTYSGDERYLEGDTMRMKGYYGGTRSIEVDGNTLNTIVFTDCSKIRKCNGLGEGAPADYTLDEIRRIVRLIFGEEVDVQSVVDDVPGFIPGPGTAYKFNIPNPTGGFTQWIWEVLYDINTSVSTDGGATWQNATFTEDYKNYYTWDRRSTDKLAVLKYCDLKGTVLWTTEFPLKSTETYPPYPFIMNGNIYVFCNEEIQIIKPADGTVEKTTVFTGDYNVLAHDNDIIIFEYYQHESSYEGTSISTIVAADSDGNVLWKGEGNGYPERYFIKKKDGDKTIIIQFGETSFKTFDCKTGEVKSEVYENFVPVY